MNRKKSNGIEWLEFNILADIPTLIHGVFLRKGGNSRPPFHSLNVSDKVGDDFSNVEKNRAQILSILQKKDPSITLHHCLQVHGKSLSFIDSHSPSEIPSCDALLTHEPHQGMMIMHADCQAAIFYDPIHHTLANVHAGWRGSVANIYAHVVQTMKTKYHSKPADLLVGISPSLGPLSSQFINYKEELPPSFESFQVKPYFFDFWAISEQQLKEVGVLPHHIEIARMDTYALPNDFFSYRRDSVTGRHATIASLR